MPSSMGSIIRGFTEGYKSGMDIRDRKDERKRREKQEVRDEAEYQRKQAEIKRLETERLNKQAYQKAVAQGITQVGTQVPDAANPGKTRTYTEKDFRGDKINWMNQYSQYEGMEDARRALNEVWNEGGNAALKALKTQGPEAAIEQFNRYGNEKLVPKKFKQTKDGYIFYRPDGTEVEVNPEQMEKSMMTLVERAKLSELQTKAKTAGWKVVGDGGMLVDSNRQIIADNPKTFSPYSRGTTGQLTTSQLNSWINGNNLQIARLQKVATDYNASIEAKEAAKAQIVALEQENAQLQAKRQNMGGLDGQAPQPKQAPQKGADTPPPMNIIGRFDPATGKIQ